ncbi:unnamed protein product [Brassica napus]|uniref:(rape) hypothetical protein n=1 Tax=Brassica napus TaxID=3708 RepID=A0A816ZZL3_BRANA|nr:unnamed protein product [Brassica napus]
MVWPRLQEEQQENQSAGVNLQEVATKHLKRLGVSGILVPSAGSGMNVDVNIAAANILVFRLNHSLDHDERVQWKRKRREQERIPPAVTR